MKKLYKSISLQLLLILCILNLTACQEYNIDSQPVGPLKIQTDAMESYSALATSPNDIVFNISSNTSWTIESDQRWCIPTPSMSASSSLVSAVSVAMESNSSDKARTATLTIKADGFENVVKTITIVQASKEDLQVIPYDEVVPTDGGVISFNIISNKPWKIIPSTQFLENIDKTEGAGREDGSKETIKINIPVNTNVLRKGEITVKTDFDEFTFVITQDGFIIEQEEPTEDGVIAFGSDETEKIIMMRSNVEWKAKVSDEYKEWIAAEALSQQELRITLLKPNQSFITRKGQIMLTTVKPIPGFEDIVLDITQAVRFNYGSDRDKFILDENLGSLKVKGNANVTSRFFVKKGHLVFKFNDFNLKSNAELYFLLSSADGDDCNINWGLTPNAGTPEASLRAGGGFAWCRIIPEKVFTSEEISKVRTVEFFIQENKELGGNKLKVNVWVDGKKFLETPDRNDVFITEGDKHQKGLMINLQTKSCTNDDYFEIISCEYTPYE